MLPKLNSRRLSWPVNWAGHYLLHLAREHPEANIIGLEISNRCLVRTEEKVERKKLQNVRLIHTLAETALHHLFEPASLTEVHINFPDPWFKSQHSHRRLMQRDTLDAIVSRLLPGGRLFLATDIIEYAEMSAALLAGTPGLDNMLDSAWASAMPGRVITKYERKAAHEGRDCYYFAYRRNDLPAPPVPVIKELEMPHVVIASPLSLNEMRAAFEPGEHQRGDAHINVRYIYEGDRSLLFDVYIKEPTIDQRVALTLVKRENRAQEYTLQLSMLGHPRPTAGVHAAVNIVTEWLMRLHPENKVLGSKVQEASSVQHDAGDTHA